MQTPDRPIVLGTGATQTVDADLVKSLKGKLVREGKVSATANETIVLSAFVDEISRWEADEASFVEYTVQPGDTWAGIAGKFYNDQARYREIMEFNQLQPNAPLYPGQKLRIPSV